MKKAVVIITSNCYASRTDFDLIYEYLRKNGWKIVRKIENADVVIINTCAYVKQKEDSSIKIIKKAQKEIKKNARLIVTGCLPAINKNRLRRIFKGTAISAKSLHQLDGVLNANIKLRNIQYVKPTGYNEKCPDNNYYRPGYFLREYRLRIGWGCKGRCSYCVVRHVFGKPHSRSIAEILEEFKTATKKGFKKFVLVANEIGVYGEDINVDIVKLLNALTQQNNNAQFAISNITPNRLKELLPRLKKFIHRKKIWRINIPVQSGSDRILGLMKRSYRINDFKHSIEKITRINPEILIESDIIIGFPSETKDDFYKTLMLTEWLDRNKVFFQIFPYDPRPNTAASKMSGQLSTKEKIEGVKKLSFLCSSYFIMKNRVLFNKWKRTRKR